MSQTLFPPKILGAIINILIKQGGVESRQTLRACALVTRAYLPRIQRYLFSDITLSIGPSCTIFSSLLAHNPILATYVQTLLIDMTGFWIEGMSDLEKRTRLSSILDAVTDVRVMLLYSQRSSFYSFPQSLQIALARRFATVMALRLIGIQDVPMRYIVTCNHLLDLSVCAPGTDGALTHNGSVSFIEEALQPTGWVPRITKSLRRLTVDHPTTLVLFSENPSHRHHIKKISLISIPSASIVQLLRTTQATLEELEIKEFNGSSLLDPVQLNLPLLRSVNITTPQRSYDVARQLLSFLLFILKGGEITPPRALQSVKLTVGVANPETVASYDIWRQFDAVLTEPRYSQFNMLNLNLTTVEGGGNIGHMRSARQKFYRVVEGLNSQGKVGFQWNGNALTSHVLFDGRVFNRPYYDPRLRRR
ncbi:hypothetical protein DXG01_008895 [Tephrocybe rancida]|nr:hypothetical protein DXG01_008895 [Tephrocybe rancida]